MGRGRGGGSLLNLRRRTLTFRLRMKKSENTKKSMDFGFFLPTFLWRDDVYACSFSRSGDQTAERAFDPVGRRRNKRRRARRTAVSGALRPGTITYAPVPVLARLTAE